MFENRVLRRIFGSRRDGVRGECRKLHNEELNDLYYSPNIVRVIKSRRMRWVGHVAFIGERRGVYRVLVGKSERKRTLGRPRLDGRVLLRWIFKKWSVGGMDCSDLAALQSEIWTPQNGAHRKPFPAATPSWKLAPRPRSKHTSLYFVLFVYF